MHQSLVAIELYMSAENVKKRMQYIIQKEAIIGQSKVTYSQICALMGPTIPPQFIDNLVLLQYEGTSFVFKYPNVVEPHLLMNTDNNLAKITLSSDVKFN